MKLLDRDLHTGLLLSVFFTMCFGCVIVFSATQATIINPGEIKTLSFNLAYKQIFFCFLALGVAFLIFLMDLKFIFDFTWFAYPISLGLLIAIFFFGKSSHGAQRWISIGFMDLQPSELAKITLILTLAKFMSWNIENRRRFHFIFFSLFLVLIPLILILRQPDLGTSLILVPILVILLFVAGIPKRYFLFLVPFAGIPLIILFLTKAGNIEIDELRKLLSFLKTYQQNRVLVFLDPNIDPRGLGYSLIQSKIAVGSGGILGKGFMLGTQTQLKFLPERHTDFIFSVLGEEWGFAGSMFLIFLYLYILREGLFIAEKCQDFFSKLAATGIVVLFFSHVVINIGMTIGLMPITGLPLPFVSYGGSSLMTSMISVGLLLNFYANRNQVLYR